MCHTKCAQRDCCLPHGSQWNETPFWYCTVNYLLWWHSTFTFMWWHLEKFFIQMLPWLFIYSLEVFIKASECWWSLYRNLGILAVLFRNVHNFLWSLSTPITPAHPHPLLSIFFPSPFPFHVPSPPRCALSRIAYSISMGPGYLQEHGQVTSEHTTKFTPSSSSSRCLKFKVGHGALSPSSLWCNAV